MLGLQSPEFSSQQGDTSACFHVSLVKTLFIFLKKWDFSAWVWHMPIWRWHHIWNNLATHSCIDIKVTATDGTFGVKSLPYFFSHVGSAADRSVSELVKISLSFVGYWRLVFHVCFLSSSPGHFFGEEKWGTAISCVSVAASHLINGMCGLYGKEGIWLICRTTSLPFVEKTCFECWVVESTFGKLAQSASLALCQEC